MQAEMNELFAEGGVMQEGGTVDPVSGNDVPVGSMQEEVRDDIPAQLSEGEFVVPADVVRYIGLEKLMAMRDKAKAGLKRMEEIGQMGNAEEVDDAEALFGDDMDDDTFSSEIDSIMNDGGEQEYAAGGDVREYAPGGYVGGAENEQLYRDAPIKGFEMVQMTNDAGQTLFIPFINGVAQLNVPDGYRVKKVGAVDTPPVTAPVESAPAQDSGGGGGADSDGGGGGGGVDDAGLATSTNVSPGAVSVIGNVLGALGIPGIATVANLGKNAIVDTLSGLSSSSAAASNQAMMAAQMGLTPAEASTPTGIAATASAVDSLSGAPVGTTAATPGASGTGSSAAAAGAAAAAAAASAGLSSEAQGAAAQAAANAALGGSSASEASQAGATAATATGNASDPDGTVGGGGPSAGDSAPSDGPAGAAVSGDPGYVKGGLVKKRSSKKTGKSTSFVTRQK